MFVLPLPDFFQELLAGAERSLQVMFARSYGRLYMQHARLFQGLFVELHRHLKGSLPGLDEALSDFWSQLLERMLPLLNPQYSFPEGYLECVGRQAESLHAFGDSPRQLRVQVSPASTRTALQASEPPYLLWFEADPLAGRGGEQALSHSQRPGLSACPRADPLAQPGIPRSFQNNPLPRKSLGLFDSITTPNNFPFCSPVGRLIMR